MSFFSYYAIDNKGIVVPLDLNAITVGSYNRDATVYKVNTELVHMQDQDLILFLQEFHKDPDAFVAMSGISKYS